MQPRVVILLFDNAQSRSIRPRAANFTLVRTRLLSPRGAYTFFVDINMENGGFEACRALKKWEYAANRAVILRKKKKH